MRDVGLAVLRVGIGILFCLYGLPKLTAGHEGLVKAGQCVGVFGITRGWALWGTLIGVTEFVGGLALVAGLGVRIAALLLMADMFTGALVQFSLGSTFAEAARPIELTILFAALVITGSGHIGLAEHFGWRWLK